MRKVSLFILMTLVAMLLASACGDGDPGATPTRTVTAEPTPTPTAPVVARYEVTMQFEPSVTVPDDVDEIGMLLQSYDAAVDFFVTTSLPPTGGNAVLETGRSDFCQTIEGELEAKTYMADASCRQLEPGEEPF